MFFTLLCLQVCFDPSEGSHSSGVGGGEKGCSGSNFCGQLFSGTLNRELRTI